MDADEVRARLDALPRARGRQHGALDVALLVGSPVLLFVSPVVASVSVVGVVLAVVAMFTVSTIPAVRHGRTDEPVVARSAKFWAIAAGASSLVAAVSIWRQPPPVNTSEVWWLALVPLILFAGLLVALYRRRPPG